MGKPKQPFSERYGPYAVVVGASEGIGRAFARELSARGLNLVLVARRDGPLASFARELEAERGITTRTVIAELNASGIINIVAAKLIAIW